MIGAREAGYAIYGAWQLARFNVNGLQYFENTPAAFWRSFSAAVIVLPAYAILVLLRLVDQPVAAGPFTVFLVQSIAYVTGWVAFPLVMYYVTRATSREQWFCRYMVAYNWAVVLQITLFLAVKSIAESGLVPPGMGALMTMVAAVAIMVYQWFIARVGLVATVPGAIGIVFIDLMVSLVLSLYSDRLLAGQGMLS